MDRISWLNMMAVGKTLEIGCEDGAVFRNNIRIDWYGIDNWRCVFQPKAGYRPDGTKVIKDIPAWQKKRMNELKELNKGRNIITADGYYLPFKENVFDTLVYAEVLEHVLDPVKFLKAGLRILKNNGRILITIPDEYSWPKRLDPFGHSGHIHHFKEKDVRAILAEINLPVKLFCHTPSNWNNGFVFWYVILQKVEK